MTRKQARQKVLDILEAQYGIDKDAISGRANFSDDLGVTGIDRWEMFHDIKDAFNIEFLWNEEQSIETVSEMIDLIMSKQ